MKYWLVPSNDSTFRIGDAIKAQGGMADWSEIDRLVYQLYGLTYDEVLIVDPATPITREEYERTS